MPKITLVIFILLFAISKKALTQAYTSFFTGDVADVTTVTKGGTVLMGGATENDNAMRWFLQRSGGGDVVVIRASGSNGYNNYLFTTLGIAVNSVQTIVFNNASAAYDPYVINQIRNAEALWIAGGDQYNYVNYWKNTPIDTAINFLINTKKVTVGGTSAGMAILGGIVNTAQFGSVTSATALNNPYHSSIDLLNGGFILNPILQNVLTDTHYDNPDRKGRHTSFLAHLFTDFAIPAKGIASEEYTAVCIDTNGIANVYGNYPANDDYAYFLAPNCVLPNTPETCIAGQPLTWNRNNDALKVYKVAGTQNGANSFNLNNWTTGTGGTWEKWHVTNGVLTANTPTVAPACLATAINNINIINAIKVYPTPAKNMVAIVVAQTLKPKKIMVTNGTGQQIHLQETAAQQLNLNISTWASGVYFLKVIGKQHWSIVKIIKQ